MFQRTCLVTVLRVAAVVATAVATAATVAQDLPQLLPEDLFRRNIGTPEQLDRQFPPHQIIDNVYYVGTESLASFLITTEAGHILVNSDFERNVATIKASVEQLGFSFDDIALILGSHEHADHMEGNVLAKELSGAQVIVMAEQVAGLQQLRPGGKEQPVDRIIKDGDQVSLGAETLTAHLTPGHSDGCTSWEFDVQEQGQTHKVVIICSVGINPNYQLWKNPERPDIVAQYRASHSRLRAIPADVPLGSHPAMYRMAEKYPLIGQGNNPFIDPEGYLYEIAINEQALNLRLEQQRLAAGE
jgi:metallo-beta-lactamase class B